MDGRKILALALVLALLGGCNSLPGGPGGAEDPSSGQEMAGETVSGIITKVNGNEVTLDLVTLERQRLPQADDSRLPAGEQPGQTESGSQEEARGPKQGGAGERPQGGAPPEGMPAGQGMPDMGELPDTGGTADTGGSQRNYTRTGESAMYQIPVGAQVVTLTGTSRNFTILSTGLLVTITLREDSVTPARVEVVQSLS